MRSLRKDGDFWKITPHFRGMCGISPQINTKETTANAYGSTTAANATPGIHTDYQTVSLVLPPKFHATEWGEKRNDRLVADESVEFENESVEVRDFSKITHHCRRRTSGLFLKFTKETTETCQRV